MQSMNQSSTFVAGHIFRISPSIRNFLYLRFPVPEKRTREEIIRILSASKHVEKLERLAQRDRVSAASLRKA